jgi:hypothetical protein
VPSLRQRLIARTARGREEQGGVRAAGADDNWCGRLTSRSDGAAGHEQVCAETGTVCGNRVVCSSSQ